jgi:hypothetical protein
MGSSIYTLRQQREGLVSATATPKQGDHVFNAVDTAVMRPFETVKLFGSPIIQHFVYDYLLHSYSMAKQIAEAPILAAGRTLVASVGAEEDSLRELLKLRPRYPALARINSTVLRDVHQRNSSRFGDAAARYEYEVLRAIQQALEAAVAPATAQPRHSSTPASPGIAFQQMLDAAYDPAAALVVITNSASRETTAIQGTFHTPIAGMVDTLDRPIMWRDPFANFREERSTATGRIITTIRDVLTRMNQLKAQSVILGKWIREEIAQKTQPAQTDGLFGSMLHLVHERLQQMGGARP